MNAEKDEPPPRLFAPAFWVALAIGLLFVLAGAGVAWVGPHLPKRHMPSAQAVGAQAAGALTGRMARGKGAGPNTRNP